MRNIKLMVVFNMVMVLFITVVVQSIKTCFFSFLSICCNLIKTPEFDPMGGGCRFELFVLNKNVFILFFARLPVMLEKN